MIEPTVTSFSLISLDSDLMKYKIKYTIKVTNDTLNKRILVEIYKIVHCATNLIPGNNYKYIVEIHSGEYTIIPKTVRYNEKENKDETFNQTKNIVEAFNNLERLLNDQTEISANVYINMIWRLLILLNAYKNNELLKEDMIFGTETLMINNYSNELDTAFDINNKYETDCYASLETIEKFLEMV